MRPIEDLGRRSETRYVLRTYAIRRGAVFGTNDRWTGSRGLSSLSSLSIAVFTHGGHSLCNSGSTASAPESAADERHPTALRIG
jgi:hypothetical protein